MKNYCSLSIALSIFLIFSRLEMVGQTPDSAENRASLPSVFDYLSRGDSLLELRIESDLHDMLQKKRFKLWQDAKISFTDRAGKPQALDVEIRPGGVSRQTICNWPPVKLRFPESFLKENGLSEVRTVEIFASCEDSRNSEQLILKEYVAYRLYNMLTDNSLRVQLARVVFYDTDKERSKRSGFAFLVEDKKSFAARKNGRYLRPKTMRPETLDKPSFDLLCLFQFMIGNTDWYPYNSHNVSFFGLPSAERPVAVCYDFDYSGFVDASYAITHNAVPIQKVTERYFMGLCRERADMEATVAIFKSKKTEMLGFCKNFKHFNWQSSANTVEYLEEFFDIIENQKTLKIHVFDKCDEWFKVKK